MRASTPRSISWASARCSTPDWASSRAGRRRGPASPSLWRQILLADEPTAEVDAATAGAMLALLAWRRDEGRATLVVTHSRAVADSCDRILRLRDGRIADA